MGEFSSRGGLSAPCGDTEDFKIRLTAQKAQSSDRQVVPGEQSADRRRGPAAGGGGVGHRFSVTSETGDR